MRRVGKKTPLDVIQKILPDSLGQVKESREEEAGQIFMLIFIP